MEEHKKFLSSGMGYGSEEIDAKLNNFDPDDPISKIKRIVSEQIDNRLRVGIAEVPEYKIYIVSFTYILGGWKAMASSNLPDGLYYEVTYNVARKETYVDTYKRYGNVCIPD